MAEGGKASFNSGSELVFDFFCELCIDDNKQVEAEGYCVDCREYLCELCFTAHKRTRSTRHHELQDKISMPQDTPLSTDRVSIDVSTKCKVHRAESVKYYCKTHDVLGCANCFATDHRKCDHVESVAEKSNTILESQGFNDFISKLQQIRKKSRAIEAHARDNKTVSQRCCAEVVSIVRKMKEELVVKLNEFEQNTVALAKKMVAEDEEKMESVVEDCKVLSEKIEALSSECESLQSSKRLCQLYINMRETESEVNKVQEKLSRIEEANVVRSFTYESNAKLTSLLRSPDALGTISLQYQQVGTPSPVTTRDPSSITAKRSNGMYVRSSSDTIDCQIYGSAVVSHNRLVVIDRYNYKVKLVDTHNNKLLSELKLSSAPWDIAVFNKTQAAVTFPDSKNIVMIKVSPSLTQEKEITVRGECRGIAYNQDRLLVTFQDNPRLEILDLRGNVIRTIENGSDGSKLFAWPWYVCVGRDSETIYVSDRERNTVTSLTCDGVVKALYKDGELSYPYKVCTDNHGNVYVCGFTSKNIHMITADCKKVKVILTQADGLGSKMRSVSHCQDTNRLFIGMEADIVQVYQLS